MPYITQEAREHLDPYIQDLVQALKYKKDWSGNLNYAITKLLTGLVPKNEFSYFELALVTGVLHNVVAEWYFRVARPYEDIKWAQNGDVF